MQTHKPTPMFRKRLLAGHGIMGGGHDLVKPLYACQCGFIKSCQTKSINAAGLGDELTR
jgi:hypothetical protein